MSLGTVPFAIPQRMLALLQSDDQVQQRVTAEVTVHHNTRTPKLRNMYVCSRTNSGHVATQLRQAARYGRMPM